MKRVGKVLYFIQHSLALGTSVTETRERTKAAKSHLFAKVEWHKCHPRSGWFPKPVAIAGPLFEPNGSATFIPISRIKNRCAVVYNKNIKFDYGEDSVVVVVPFKSL